MKNNKTQGRRLARSPAAEDFVQNELGLWSSHPAYGFVKAKWIFRLPIICVGLVFVWFLWKGANLEWNVVVKTVQGKSMGALVGGLALVFFGAYATTAILIARATSVRISDGEPAFPERADSEGRLAGSYIVITGGAILSGVLFFYLPDLIPGWMGDPIMIAHFSFIAAVLPFILTLALFDFYSPKRRERSSWWFLVVLLALLFVSCLLASWSRTIGEKIFSSLRLDAVPFIGPEFLSSANGMLESLFQLSALTVLLLMIWVLGEWTLAGIAVDVAVASPSQTEETPARSNQQRTRLGRLIQRLRKKEDSEDIPEWFVTLCRHLPEECGDALSRVAGPVAGQDMNECAQPSPDRQYGQIFGGLNPSQDQLNALRRFISRHIDALGSDTTKRFRGMDLLLEGQNGAGKTTTLLACAVASLILRGERVALFASDASSRAFLVSALNEILQGNDIHYFCSAEEVTVRRMQLWTENPELFPQILVASPENWELAFYGKLCGHPQADFHEDRTGMPPGERIRKWLLSITTILVDDIASALWSSGQVVHLPFLVDKHRLVLSAAMRPLQVIATTTQLPHDSIREVIIRRLFSHDEAANRETNLMKIRPWQKRVAPRVELVCHDRNPVLFRLICRSLQLKKRVLFFLREDAPQARELFRETFTKNLRVWADENFESADQSFEVSLERFCIICHLMEVIDGLESDEDRAIIYEGSLTDPILPQLTSRYANEKTVVMALVQSSFRDGAIPDRPGSSQPMGFPLLVSRTAPPLMISHLQSAAIHFLPGMPVRRDDLSRFGVQSVGCLPHPKHLGPGTWRSDEALSFDLDPRESGAIEQREEIWPMVCYRPDALKQSKGPQPVSSEKLLDFGAGYCLNSRRNTLEFGTMGDPAIEQRGAIWKDKQGVDIKRVDLASLDELNVVRDGQRYWCENVRADSRGIYNLIGDIHRSIGSEAVLPVWSIELLPRFGASAESSYILGVNGPRMGGPVGAVWVELFLASKDQSGGAMGQYSVPAFDASIVIRSAMTKFRIKGPPLGHPLKFSYPASISALLLNTDIQGENPGAKIADLLSCAWSTEKPSERGKFWPELTLAIQTGLRAFAPRFTQFCRLAAFRLGNGDATDPKAVLFFIEPQGTAGTIRQMMAILQDYYPSLTREQVVEPARWALNNLAWSGPGFTTEDLLDRQAADELLTLWTGG